MEGHKFLKVTGILMIIAAVFSIIAGVFVGGLGALAAGFGAASGLTFAYWAALFLTLVGGIFQLIAGIKGVKHSKRSEKQASSSYGARS
jgi:membrane protein implicated in regulation of membrane protease activity